MQLTSKDIERIIKEELRKLLKESGLSDTTSTFQNIVDLSKQFKNVKLKNEPVAYEQEKQQYRKMIKGNISMEEILLLLDDEVSMFASLFVEGSFNKRLGDFYDYIIYAKGTNIYNLFEESIESAKAATLSLTKFLILQNIKVLYPIKLRDDSMESWASNKSDLIRNARTMEDAVRMLTEMIKEVKPLTERNPEFVLTPFILDTVEDDWDYREIRRIKLYDGGTGQINEQYKHTMMVYYTFGYSLGAQLDEDGYYVMKGDMGTIKHLPSESRARSYTAVFSNEGF